MKTLIVLFLLCSFCAFAFDCSDYISGATDRADVGHIEFCRAVIGNQKVINENQKILDAKMDALMTHFGINFTQINGTSSDFTSTVSQAAKPMINPMINPMFAVMSVAAYLVL